MVTVQELNELAARHELALSLNKSDPGFSLSNDDMRMIAAALRQAASERHEIERLQEKVGNRDILLAMAQDLATNQKAEIARLRAACERMMIGGNHIATYRTERWPDYGSEPMDALEKLGAGQEYDMWCCWNAIMCARATLKDTTP